MTKTKISAISSNYAKALIETASGKSSFEQTQKELKSILDTIESSSDLKVVLNNSAISMNIKLSIVEDIFKGKIEDSLLNFLKLIIKNNRIEELYSIYSAYNQIYDNLSNVKTVQIISSIDLNKETKERIIEKLQYKLHSNITPKWEIDKSIISGLIIKFGDYVVDTSVKTKLENLSKNILR